MNYILFDEKATRENLLPFTFTRPVGDIRIGILTIREKWEKYLRLPISTATEIYLAEKFPAVIAEENIFINGSVLPDERLLKSINSLKEGETLVQGKTLLAASLTPEQIKKIKRIEDVNTKGMKAYSTEVIQVNNSWDIFLKNEEAIKRDFILLTKGRKSKPISKSNRTTGKGKIFLEEGVKMENVFLNTTDGPIYIGKNAEVMEGSMIRGPFALGESSTLKLGTKIYGGTTIGPHCKVGGEVSNSVFFGYSNKAHDGFIGNSVIGEWCNLGANTNNSNLKNNYSSVKVWNYNMKDYVDSGLTFCGLMMGDHSKSGISVMFNTGTVVGVSANVFGGGFPPKMIPSFAWGGSNGFSTFRIDDALDVAKRVMERRHIRLTNTDASVLKVLFNQTTGSKKKQTAKLS